MDSSIKGNRLIFKLNGLTAEISVTSFGAVRFRAYAGKPKPPWVPVISSEPEFLPLKARKDGVSALAGAIQVKLSDGGSFEVFCDSKSCFSAPEGCLSNCDEVISLTFRVSENERIYGLGQDPMAKLNQNGRERRMWNQWGGHERSGNMGLGFFSSSAGYGILLANTEDARFLFNNAEPPELDLLGEAMVPSLWKESAPLPPESGRIEVRSETLDLYLLLGCGTADHIKGYYRLTGLPSLPPKWAFGLMQCKNRYKSRVELESVAKKLRKEDIPCDTLIIDWLWFREFGDLEWREDCWPDVGGMLENLKNDGFHVMSAQHPFISEKSKYYDYYKEKGYLNEVPETKRKTYDHTNPEAREHWWRKTAKLHRQGLAGYWMDMGELEEHFDGTKSAEGDRNLTHNAYTLMWAKGIFEGQKRDFGSRAAMLVRSGCAGMQKYGAILWSGDISASWQVLKDQVRVLQGVAMSGLPYWTTDIGGFLTHTDFSPELYLRWLEWGVFCPVFRTHGTRPGNEPWSFGKNAMRHIRDMIKLRYRLTPYIYSISIRNALYGDPIVTPMSVAYPDCAEAACFDGQYLFGDDMLIAPVTGDGQRRKEVWLPGGKWYHLFNGRVYEPGVHQIPAPPGEPPVFVRAGAVLPVYSEIGRNIEGCGNLTMLLFPTDEGVERKTEYFDAAPDGFDYLNGDYTHVILKYDDRGDKVAFETVNGETPDFETKVFAPPAARCKFTLDCDKRVRQRVKVTLTALCGAKTALRLEAPEGWSVTACSAGGCDTEIYKKLYCQEWENNIVLAEGEAVSWTLEADGAWLLLGENVVTVKAGEETLTEGFDADYLDSFETAAGFPVGENGLDTVYEPELDPVRPYYEYENRRITWQRDILCAGSCFGYVDIRRFYADLSDEELSGVAYLRENLYSESSSIEDFFIRHDCGLKLRINGKPVYQNEDASSEGTIVSFPLEKGINTIIVKLYCRVERPYSGAEYGISIKYVGVHNIWQMY